MPVRPKYQFGSFVTNTVTNNVVTGNLWFGDSVLWGLRAKRVKVKYIQSYSTYRTKMHYRVKLHQNLTSTGQILMQFYTIMYL